MRIPNSSAPFFSIAVSLSVLVGGGAWAQTPAKDQCSLAVVSRLAVRDGPVCDMATVQQLAQSGHAFDQNQLGIASMLVVGPDQIGRAHV